MARARRHHPGGIAGLLELLDQHEEAIEADLQAHYRGLTLAQVGTPALSLRKLRGLIEQLPLDSAYGRATHGEHALWSLEAHLLAAAVDRLAAGNWQRGGGKGGRPKPIRRPGAGVRRIGGTTVPQAQVRAYLDRLKPATDR